MNMSVESEGVTDNDPEFNPAEYMSDLSSSDISFQIEPEPIVRGNMIKSVRHLNLGQVAVESDRRNVSNRKAAAILNAGFAAVGLITQNDRRLVVDQHKIRRERIKARKSIMIMNNVAPLLCFSFDGKKDKTLLNSDTGNHIDIRKLENISILRHPEHEFMGIVSTEDSTSRTISEALIDFFYERDISLEKLIGIASDGTNTNTGCNKGIIYLIERELQRPVHWFICLLHLLECVMRNVFIYLDGKTSGPSDYVGPIGKELKYCDTKPIVEFQPVAISYLPDNILEFNFTNDQKLLVELAKAVNSGNCSLKLSIAKIGKIHNARWITMASRVLRLYMTKRRPTPSLEKLVQFVMSVYVPAWFRIKEKPKCTSGSLHFFNILENSRKLDTDVFDVAFETLSRNAFFAHSENLLLAMIADDDQAVRQRAYEIIINCRKRSVEGVRKFETPKINEDCRSYTELIDWSCDIHEPPFTRNLPLDVLEIHMNSEQIVEVPDFECHSQRTEHCVQAMSDAVHNVAGNP